MITASVVVVVGSISYIGLIVPNIVAMFKGDKIRGTLGDTALFGAIFVAIFAQIMARVNRAPATIFLCVCVFPLVPGPNLYYMMYYLVLENYKVAKEEAVTLVLTCVGIALGFIVVDIFNKYIVIIFKRLKGQLISEHGERY